MAPIVILRRNDVTRLDIDQPVQRPALGFFVYVLVIIAGMGGLLFGYDTGIVSGAMLYVPDDGGMKPMGNMWKELIVAVTPGMAGVGSLIAGPSSDRYGRKRTIVAASAIFTLGGLICGMAPEKFSLLFGRVLLGLAIGRGFAHELLPGAFFVLHAKGALLLEVCFIEFFRYSVILLGVILLLFCTRKDSILPLKTSASFSWFASAIVPVFVSESCPSYNRGRLVSFYQLNITFGFFAAGLFAGSFSYVDPTKIGWRLMFGFAALPSAIQLIVFFFLPESPRWLYANGKLEETEKVLSLVYNGNKEWIAYELSELHAANADEAKKMEILGDGSILLRIFRTAHVRKALFVGCALQAFQQLCGINALTFYAGTIIRSAGVRNKHASIWFSTAVSSLNFTVSMVPMLLVDRIGRRPLLLLSVVGVFVSLLLLGGGFLLINRDSVGAANFLPADNETSMTSSGKCGDFSNCDYCVTAESCGFCQNRKNQGPGYCFPFNDDDDSLSKLGPCSLKNQTGDGLAFEWMDDYCHTKYTALPIVLMVVYVTCFQTGFGLMPVLLNAEFYPLWARSTCASLANSSSWFLNMFISLTFLTLSQAITKFGAFFFYAGITFVALVIFYLTVPETKGYSIEEVEMLFMSGEERRQAMEKMAVQLSKDNDLPKL